MLTCGVGPARAGGRTQGALQRWDAEIVMSFGTCGALSEDLPDGSVVTGAALGREAGGSVAVLPLSGARAVSVATVDRVVVEPDRRARLAARGFAVCEMEAYAVAQAAGGRDTCALKVVSDQAGQDASPVFHAPRLGQLPSPIRVARFQARALRLVEARLLPVLLSCLRESARGP